MSSSKRSIKKELWNYCRKYYNQKEQTQEFYACLEIYTRIISITTKLGRQASIEMQDQWEHLAGTTLIKQIMLKQQNASKMPPMPTIITQIHGLLLDAAIWDLNNFKRLLEHSVNVSLLMILKAKLGEIWQAATCIWKKWNKPSPLYSKQ